MLKTVTTGTQSFSRLKENNYFLIDKTVFIKEWWDRGDDITLITRPRRFGKTLNLDMLRCFFSSEFAGRSDLFEGMKIWEDEKYRKIQGTYPVISFSFAGVKNSDFKSTLDKINLIVCRTFEKIKPYVNEKCMTDVDREFTAKVNLEMEKTTTEMALNVLCKMLYQKYKVKPIILIDEYDTPMQEAWMSGYWNEMIEFMRSFFNNTLKTNEYLGRALLTGITRVSRESLFSDLNNLKTASISSGLYAEYFGFTEKEVNAALDEYGYTEKDEVKRWYDGFKIGDFENIYNPWSVIGYLSTGKFEPYWSNTSSNGLVNSLIKYGDSKLKSEFMALINNETIFSRIDDQLVYSQLDGSSFSVWSLLVATGYLKIISKKGRESELKIVNGEVMIMFEDMVSDWFDDKSEYSYFIKALLQGKVKDMKKCLEQLMISMVSFFDGGKKVSEKLMPERFYHGFILGMMVDLKDRYNIISNRECGLGRADIIMKPKNSELYDGIIIEFKVRDPEDEKTLKDTVDFALEQIEEMKYEQILLDEGIKAEHIKKYGFAFEGKSVEIGNK